MIRLSDDQIDTAKERGGHEYGDGDIPEIDTSHYRSDATNHIPDEIQRHNSTKTN